jgi:hypothetical protein
MEVLDVLLDPFALHTKSLEADTMCLSFMLPAILDLEEHLKQVTTVLLAFCFPIS